MHRARLQKRGDRVSEGKTDLREAQVEKEADVKKRIADMDAGTKFIWRKKTYARMRFRSEVFDFSRMDWEDADRIGMVYGKIIGHINERGEFKEVK